MKILWYDTETTGLDPVKQDIIQFAGIMEIDGKVVDEIEVKMQPISYENVEQGALDVHGYSLEDFKSFPSAREGYLRILQFLDQHVSKFDKTDKLLSAGQNIKFDMEFLRQNFIKNNNVFFGSYFDYHFIDLQAITALMIKNKKLGIVNYKLETVCKELGIEIVAHDAISDIRATKACFEKYEQMLGLRT